MFPPPPEPEPLPKKCNNKANPNIMALIHANANAAFKIVCFVPQPPTPGPGFP